MDCMSYSQDIVVIVDIIAAMDINIVVGIVVITDIIITFKDIDTSLYYKNFLVNYSLRIIS